jgi:phosphatidylglycerophosphatase A
MKIGWRIISTFFGTGYFPIGPGTMASAVVVLLYKFLLSDLSWPLYLLIIIVLFIVGGIAATKYSSALQQKDPRKIVIDEVCGQLCTLFLVPSSWPLLLLAFVLFRLFDIIKPCPIKKLERIRDGWGIMADDIMAAVYAGIPIHLYLLLR